MNRMLVKNTLRDIRKTKARFIAIMLIIMLSVGFLVGINSVSPSMFAVAQEYYAQQNLMDFRLISTVGFTEEDIKAVSEVEGVKDVMPSYFMDVLPVGETGDVVRLFALPESYKDYDVINDITLREGRLPEDSNEIVIGASRFGDFGIGSRISFTSPVKDEELSDTLKNTEFEIVGIVDSPMYISFERGATNVGSGKVAAYMMIPKENFLIERCTDLYVTFSSLYEVKPYSAQYDEICESITETLEGVGDVRIAAFEDEEIGSAQTSIDEAEVTLADERKKADDEIEKAQKQIDDGYKTLDEEEAKARETLVSARIQIDTGKKELQDKETLFSKTIADAKAEISEKEEELTAGEAQIKEAKIALKETLFESVSKFGMTHEQYESFYGGKDMLSKADVEKIAGLAQMYRTEVVTRLDTAEDALLQLEAQLTAAGVDPQTNPEYLTLKLQRDNLKEMLLGIDTFLTTGKAELLAAIETINKQEETLSAGRMELEGAKATIKEQEEQGLASISQAEKSLEDAEAQYNSGLAELESTISSGEEKLKTAQSELDTKKKEADEEFLKAEREIQDAQDKLDVLLTPEWLYHTRSNNPGYDAYVDDVGRVAAVGKVFPVFFMLVAILVCVTTMSRLIEEQRSDIGAFTTLGYRRKDIIAKYIIYSLSASIIGSALGLVWGLPTIPYVIYNAYGMLYSSMPDLILTISVGSAIIATAGAMLCTTCVSFITCYSLLRKKPATLLRPKAPKPGKRIFLEKVKFIWDRLGFFSKVTVRNIFRYKARFFMTVIGVAGCTALVFAALGLYSSINDVVSKQFGEIFNYDAIVALEDSSKAQDVKTALLDDERLEDVSLCRQNLTVVMGPWGRYTDDTYICVPENTEDFKKIVNLRERKSGEPVEIGENGVVLSEKLATKLKLSVGDMVIVEEKGKRVELVLDGICENYLYGYAYMSPEVYEANFGFAPEYNMFMCTEPVSVENDHSKMGEDFLKEEGVLGVSFTSDSTDTFREMIKSLDYVVLVMLVCAGALAFVVLYNLTNINIAERKREISTLKVLGFKNSETSAYIYRENLVLTLVGASAGLVLGIWFLKFVIKTVEMDMLMFGREMYLMSFVIAFALTFVFSVIVNLVMHLRIKKIDMIESLKSVE